MGITLGLGMESMNSHPTLDLDVFIRVKISRLHRFSS